MGGQALSRTLGALIVATCVSWGCHAADDDPEGQAKELDDPVRRQHAIARLTSIEATRRAVANGNRAAPALVEFNDVTHAQLVKTYLEHPEDSQNGLAILNLMFQMRDPRTLPALIKALDWRAEVSEDHAITAANTFKAIAVPEDKRGEVVAAISAALKRVQGARPLDNRLRVGLIEALGKLGDRRAIPTLMEVALRQEESQNFLFNKLAVQQLVGMPDPSAVEGLIKALYMFDPAQPRMRMDDDAQAALLAIGKPALDPLVKTARGENPEVNRLVDLSIEAVRRANPQLAATLVKKTLVPREAVVTLGRLGYRDALPLLLAETKAEDTARAFTAAIALIGIAREPQDTKPIVAAIEDVYDRTEKEQRPQLLVAMRHLYADEAMPVLLKVAKTTETELPPIQAYAWLGYALLANKSEAKALLPILDREERIRDELKDYRITAKLAETCDEALPCWQAKLKDANKVVVRKSANMLARYGRGNAGAIAALVEVLGHSDLEVRNEALSAIDSMALRGSDLAVKKIGELQVSEAGRSIWNSFSQEALPTRSRLQLRAGS